MVFHSARMEFWKRVGWCAMVLGLLWSIYGWCDPQGWERRPSGKYIAVSTRANLSAIGFLMLVVSGIFLSKAGGGSRVRLTAEALTLETLSGTTRLPWKEITSLDVPKGRSIVLSTGDGRKLTLGREFKPFDDMLLGIEQRLASAHQK